MSIFCARRLYISVGGLQGGFEQLGLEEIQPLAALAKVHLQKPKSVRLSSLDASEWGHIQKNAGCTFKAMYQIMA